MSTEPQSAIAKAIRIAYPNAVKQDRDGYYWQNLDGDRFSFSTFDEAAEDLAVDIGMTEREAHQVIHSGRAVA